MFDPEHLQWGRVEQFDEASRAYGITRHLAATKAPTEPRNCRWHTPRPMPLDQGRTSECVAFTAVHLALAAPVLTTGLGAADAHRWYRECKRIDGIHGEGTSILAGAKTAKRHGIVASYSWAFTEPELALAVSYVGPAWIGVRWRQGMMHPDRNGFLNLTGADLGGHSVAVIGLDLAGAYYLVMSSWGADWADRGVAKIRRRDMATLLRRRGDACIPVQVGATPGDQPAPDTTTPAPKPTPPKPRPPAPPRPPRPHRRGPRRDQRPDRGGDGD